MDFALSREAAGRFEFLDEAGSTNDVLVAHATGTDAGEWPDLSVVVTDNQTRGRGRLGRTWLAPTGKSLAISVLLRPVLADGTPLPVDAYGWFPLLAGAAMTRAVRSMVEEFTVPVPDVKEEEIPRHEVALKWPNDVLIDGYKVSGILSELLPDAGGLIIGAGLNVALDEHDLPTLTSTSLLLVTREEPDPDLVLSRYLTELTALYREFLAADGDPIVGGLHATVSELCGTIDSPVRIELPGGDDLVGLAIGLDDNGRLIVRDRADDELQSVAAGDVTHLRY